MNYKTGRPRDAACHCSKTESDGAEVLSDESSFRRLAPNTRKCLFADSNGDVVG